MQIPSSLKDYLEITALILGLVGVIIPMTKAGRNWIKNVYTTNRDKRDLRNRIPLLLTNIDLKVSSMDDRLKQVEYDVKSPNGGSTVKGLLKLIKAELDVTNWLSPRPSFRTTSSGINTSVNEAYCHLCGVTSDELMKLGWKNFLADEEQGDDYYARFLQATKELSQFSGKLKIQSNRGEYRGEWLARVRPLGPIDDNGTPPDYLWSGSLYPFDETAKSYARAMNIPLFI